MQKKKPNLCEKKNECCGCTACATICPRQAISFAYDAEGFLYPEIDFTACIGCLQCEAVCSFKIDMRDSIGEDKNTRVFAAKSKNANTVAESSSGGMFTVLSDAFFQREDIVAACYYSYETSSVELSLFYDKEKRDEARGSKYIQAELKNSYRNLIDALRKNQDKKALVFGTGCQIAGLDLLLKKLHLRDRVLLIDLICHGAASSRLWKEYASKLEREQGAKISYITFKNKRNGWESPSAFAIIDGKEIPIKPYSDWFYMGWNLRESCYNCPYTKIDRMSDMTIGDYWGIQNVLPEFYDPMGVSLVIVHTADGMKLFDHIRDKVDYVESNRKDCLQPRLVSPQLRPNNRDCFWRDMEQNGMDYCIEKYKEHYAVSVKEKVKRFLKKLLDK